MDNAGVENAPRLSLTRSYAVAPEKVWRAWVEPEALMQWFGPGETGSVTLAEVDLRVGGRYHFVFHTPDGEDHDVSGVYQEVIEHRRLAFTWAWRSTPERVSRVTIELRPIAAGTELSFLQEHFADVQARDAHEGGWLPTLAKLEAFLGAARSGSLGAAVTSAPFALNGS